MGIVGLVILLVVIAGIVIAAFGWDRYRGSRKATSSTVTSQPTGEVFLDPETGVRVRVWYDQTTGQREYRAE
jgi:hypothetical protein